MTFRIGRHCARRRRGATRSCLIVRRRQHESERAMHDSRPFAAALLDARRPIPDGLRDNRRGCSARRFAVYRNNVVTSLIKALKSRFPVTEKIVGEEFFAGHGARFVLERPPRTRYSRTMAMNLPHSSTSSSRRANLPIWRTWRGSRPRARAPITQPTRRRSTPAISRRSMRTQSAIPGLSCSLPSRSFGRRIRLSRSGR